MPTPRKRVAPASTKSKRGARKSRNPSLKLSKAAFKRVADILEKGGRIHTIHYSLPKRNGMVSEGISYLTEEAERDWRIVK